MFFVLNEARLTRRVCIGLTKSMTNIYLKLYRLEEQTCGKTDEIE